MAKPATAVKARAAAGTPRGAGAEVEIQIKGSIRVGLGVMLRLG